MTQVLSVPPLSSSMLTHGPADILSYPARWAAVASGILLASLYAFVVVLRLKPGWPRLLASIPVFLFNFSTLFIFDPARLECLDMALLCILTLVLGNLRLLAICMNRGKLITAAFTSNPAAFFLGLYFPVRLKPALNPEQRTVSKSDSFEQDSLIKEVSAGTGSMGTATSNSRNPARSLTGLLVGSLAKAVLLFFTVSLYTGTHSTVVTLLFHAATVFLLMSLAFETLGTLVAVAAPGFLLLPHFNAPYLASSFSDFWANRWNLTVSESLREAVYDPVAHVVTTWERHGTQAGLNSKVAGGPAAFGGSEGAGASSSEGEDTKRHPYTQAARLSAVAATFLVSGVLHELSFWGIAGRATGEVALFFVLQGALVALEGLTRVHKAPVRRPIKTAVVLAIMLATARLCFFAPLQQAGLTECGMAEARSFFYLPAKAMSAA